MVPRVGVEPTLPKEPDFESSASANSAIWAHLRMCEESDLPDECKASFERYILLVGMLAPRRPRRGVDLRNIYSAEKRNSVVDLKVSPALRMAPPISGKLIESA